MRSSWVLQVRPKPTTSDAEVETETGVVTPKAKEHPEPPQAGRGKEVASLRAIGKSMALPTPSSWTLASRAPEEKKYPLF